MTQEVCEIGNFCLRDKGHQSPVSPCFIGYQNGKDGYYRFQDGKEWVRMFEEWPKDAKERFHWFKVQK